MHCEPFGVGLHAVRRGSVGHGDTVSILGAGTIGSVTMEAAKAAGATDIIVADIVDSKLERAVEHGADATVNVTRENFADVVEAYTDGRGADVVFEATDSKPDLTALIDAARRGGTVVMIGLADEATVEIDWIADFTEPLDNVKAAFERARDDDDVIKGMITIGE